jgi:hypothetical protein
MKHLNKYKTEGYVIHLWGVLQFLFLAVMIKILNGDLFEFLFVMVAYLFITRK